MVATIESGRGQTGDGFMTDTVCWYSLVRVTAGVHQLGQNLRKKMIYGHELS